MAFGQGLSHAQPNLSYLQSMLASTPEGGWVPVNSTTFASAWPTGADAVPAGTYSDPRAVVRAWSSVAWDSTRGQMILWGGGHANYMGNEIYLWQGTDGAWTRGSLPSSVTAFGNGIFFASDLAAPQSAHTYDNNMYLPINDMFVTFGGAVFNTGGQFTSLNVQGNLVQAGPWLWDPRKANPNQVGGANGSGNDPSRLGGNMWINRQGQWTGTEGPRYIEGTAAYRTENGHDVVYLSMDSQQSGWPMLYRYQLGDIRNGELDRWDLVGGNPFVSQAFQGAGAIDSAHDLYVRTAAIGNSDYDLLVWSLASVGNASNVRLVKPDGTPFVVNVSMGLAYDSVHDQFLMWDNNVATEAVYAFRAQPQSTVWTVYTMMPTTSAKPTSGSFAGVLGKWQYIEELGAFLALEEYSASSTDAKVWLYKPMAAVPEPMVTWMFLTGFGVLLVRLRFANRR